MTDTLIKGGKRAIIGEVRIFNGKPYTKTSSGWRPQSNKMAEGKMKSADDHAFLHSSGKYAIDTLDPDSGVAKFKPGDKVSWIHEVNGKRYHATVHEKQLDDNIHALTDIKSEDTKQSIDNWIHGRGDNKFNHEKGIPLTRDLDADDFIEKISKTTPGNAGKIAKLRQEIAAKLKRIEQQSTGGKYDGPDKDWLIQTWKRVDAYLTHHQSKRSPK